MAAAAEEATEAAGDVGGIKANVGMYRYCGGGGAAPGSFFFKKDAGKDAPTPPPIVLLPLIKRYFNILLFIFNFSNKN